LQCNGETKSGDRCKRRAGDSGYCTSHEPEPTPEVMLKSHYADRCGFTPQYVNQLINQGVIIPTNDGKVDVVQADAAIRKHSDPSKRSNRKGTPDPSVPHGHDSPHVDEDDYQARYIRARALLEEEKHEKARIERLQIEGALVLMADVQRDAANLGSLVRAKIMNIPDRVSGQLVGIRDVLEIKRILNKELRQALSELGDAP
jgi:phage terminase Nu1 subunit (DNA packaging protein)